MQKSALKGTLLAFGLALSGATFAASPSAEMLSNTCFGCHGPNGNSVGPSIPTIAGLSETYLVDTMTSYKEGERAATIMTRIAKGYSDDEIAAMAGYFSSQKFAPADQTADAKMAKAGAKLHDKYCEKCHSEGATLADDDAGLLAGQWTPYLKHALTDFVAGNRDMPKKMKKQLNKMKKKAGDESVDQVFSFYASKK